MPRLLSALFLTSALALSACSDSGAEFVGTWRQASVREDGITTRYTFFADGRAQIVVRPPAGAAQTYGARYRVEADSLLTLQDAQGAERFVARVTGDTLRLRSPVTGRRTMLYRVGG
ncbi:MAG TPA: hypothetical protein EYQ24_07865 [Bacteroidetes bacterium]|nr:hypothetical protein [Bacteroidota bacterium]HIL58622.1 hypothetical protein [Rhodothermales bacterium]